MHYSVLEFQLTATADFKSLSHIGVKLGGLHAAKIINRDKSELARKTFSYLTALFRLGWVGGGQE